MALLLAPLLLAASAAATQDASALVQAAVHRHDDREAPGLGGIYLERFSKSTNGNRVLFNVSTGCEVSDELGQNNCTLHWGQEVTTSVTAELADGLQQGDTLYTLLNVTLGAENKSSEIAKLIPGTPTSMASSCTICEGSCSSATIIGGLTLTSTSPSLLTSEAICGTGADYLAHMTNVTLSHATFQLPPGFDPAFQLTGFLTATGGLRRHGEVAVSHSTKLTLIPGDSASLVGMQAGGAKPKTPGSFLQAMDQALRQTVPAMLKEGHKPETVAKYNLLRGNRASQKINALVVKVRQSEPGANAVRNSTFTADRACTTSAEEGTECKFFFNDASNVTMKSYSAFTADEGSYANVSVTTKVGGLLGMMLSSLMKPVKQTVPLCGHNATMVIDGVSKQIDAGPCGFFSASIESTPFELFVPDFGLMPTKIQGAPMMPSTLADWPPVTVQVDVVRVRGDGALLGSEHWAVSLDHAE